MPRVGRVNFEGKWFGLTSSGSAPSCDSAQSLKLTVTQTYSHLKKLSLKNILTQENSLITDYFDIIYGGRECS